ncbi:chemotaxis protein CheW [Pseudoduganella sp. FT25W]|uniref:Chemotaxis protein CheW n=1 Tax=Duganella alba TaxID=2666081 RepID=A0A6L5QH33_9BURK|nr:chemotaxis protein CheW [Duganella alba]MRX09019.1 chemotaxis protein CheW [Duganella alba]MRX15703.1 chemotaxis protein CheW [Duganella alba]
MTTLSTTTEEFLTFTLGSEQYGLSLTSIQELRSYERVTQLLNLPDYVKGVINLRGVIVPVVDLRIKLGTGTPIYDQFTSVIVVNHDGHVVGMVVDSVLDVVALAPADIRPPPEIASTQADAYISGIGATGNRLLVLLDVARLMLGEDIVPDAEVA